jgi:uncharacterized protein YyaL (SSP411 family)
LRLFELTGRELYRERAEQVFAMYRAAAAQNPFGFAHLLAAQDFVQRGPISIVMAGERCAASALVASLQRRYLPARVLAFAEDVPIGAGRQTLAGQTTAYVCRNRTCETPVTNAAELVERCLK